MRQFNQQILYVVLLLAFTFLCFGQVSAQKPKRTPTPKPSPTPIVEGVKKSSLEDDDAEKNVEAEKLGNVPKIAPNFKSRERDLPSLSRVGVNMNLQKPISLKEAIVKGLENNIDIEVTRKDVEIAEYDLKAADGFYEPSFSGQTFFQRATSPNISIFSPNLTTTDNTLDGNLRYQGSLRRFGTTYFAEGTRQRFTTNDPISILSPQNNLNLSFGFTQPLMRGRKFDNQRRVVEIAKKNLSLTDVQFRQKAIEITANIQRAYWDLTFTLKNLQVQRDGVRDAKEQLAHNRRLVKEGVLAPIDIVAAETQVANLEQNVYTALEQVQRAENFLKSLISGSRTDAVWSDALVPTDSVSLEIPKTRLQDALTLALNNRPELQINKFAGDINKLDQKLYRELDKPKVDLTASYSTLGVSGNFNNSFQTPFQPASCQPDPTSAQCIQDINALNTQIRTTAQAFTGGTQSTYTDILRNRYPTYRVGLTFNLPLFGNKTNKANLGKSLVQADRINLQHRQLEQIIELDVRNTLQSLRTAEARLRALAVARENSEKQYESEKRKLNAGLSDIYKVLERQTALMNARSAEIQAQTELNKAIADLQRATGNSLEANEVETKLRD